MAQRRFITKKVLAVIAILTVGVGIGVVAHRTVAGDNVYDQAAKISMVLGYAQKQYVDEVDTQKLTEAAIKGMLNELDPHSVYIPPKELSKVTEDFQGSFDGIGIEFDIIADTITIVSPISGGPSDALGILAGDQIIRIDNQSAVGLTREDVPKKLRGKRGTIVKVDIKRSGEAKPLEFSITRDKIPLYSVSSSFMVDGDIGYVAVNRFIATTHDELVDATDKLRGQGMQKLVLDLRGNPGGYMDQAYRMADDFVKGGYKIVYTKGRRPESDEDLISTSGGKYEKTPLIVLIDGGSASASEIVSGAVQDLDRGLVVGETSFGKGLVQRQFDLADGSAFRLTIARYYTPSGRLIQRPYKDKDKYYRGVGREEGEEGDNITHKSDAIKDTSRPVFKTLSGRKVYGGGGITPDYIVKSDTINLFSRQLRIKNVFQEYALNSYLKTHIERLKSDYGSDMLKFVRSFVITPSMLDDFKAVAKAKGIEWDEKQYQQDKDYIDVMIRARIAYGIWGQNGSTAVFTKIDRQLQKALTLFPEAMKVAKLQ